MTGKILNYLSFYAQGQLAGNGYPKIFILTATVKFGKAQSRRIRDEKFREEGKREKG